MKKNSRIISVIALYAICILFYALFFLFQIENTPLFLVLTFGSVAVLSTSTIYTVIQSKGGEDKKIKEKKYFTKTKSIQKDSIDIIEDYVDAMPSIEEYVESDESYKEIPIIDKYIFSILSKEELEKIDHIKLPKMDKILFIREMLYFNPEERELLIDNMLKNKENTDGDIFYTSPTSPIEMEDQIRLYVRSLVEPGEKTKIIIVDTTELIGIIKEKISLVFDYRLEDFLLSSGGILLKEDSLINEYDIDDDDEIALIPTRNEKN